MSRIALVFAFILALIGPASAQKAEVEAANAKWIESFNKATRPISLGSRRSTPLMR